MERIKLSFSSHCLPCCQNLILCLPLAIHLNSHCGTGNISLCLKIWGALWCSHPCLCEESKSRTGKYCPQAVSHLLPHMEANSISQCQCSLLTSDKQMPPNTLASPICLIWVYHPFRWVCARFSLFQLGKRKNEYLLVWDFVWQPLAVIPPELSWHTLTSVLQAMGLANKIQFKLVSENHQTEQQK